MDIYAVLVVSKQGSHSRALAALAGVLGHDCYECVAPCNVQMLHGLLAPTNATWALKRSSTTVPGCMPGLHHSFKHQALACFCGCLQQSGLAVNMSCGVCMQGFSPMNKFGLNTVMKLASCYGLKSSAQGSGKKQFVVVCHTTCLSEKPHLSNFCME